jgi:hypothetical protein
MKALISPNELIEAGDGGHGYRVAQVADTAFDIAAPLFWVDCPNDCTADAWYFDAGDGTCKPVPAPYFYQETPVEVLP